MSEVEELKQHITHHIEVLKLNQEQLEFEKQTVENNIKENEERIQKLQSKLNTLTEKELVVSVKEYLEPELYELYYPNIEMLYEEDMWVSDWLSWFYEELPFIRDKHLQFIGKQTGKHYSIAELNGLVKTDKKNQEIFVLMGELVVISLGSVNLFQMLCVMN